MPHTFRTIAVIVGLDLVGDALIKLPFVRALRAAFPEARIVWHTTKGKTFYNGPLREIVKPFIDEVVEMSDLSTPHDLVLDTRNRWKLALQARKMPHKVFIAPAMRYLFSDRRPLMFWRRQPHMQDRLLELVRLAAGNVPVVSGGIAVPDAYRAKAAMALPEGRAYVGLVPGAGNVVKIWPRERFVELAVRIAATGKIPAFLLGPDETSWQAELQRAVPQAKFPLQDTVWEGKYELPATMAIGERLALAVTNDNGTSHMLAAVDCALVSLFGPTSAKKLVPRVLRRRLVTAQDFGGDAMALIPVAAVAKAVEELG